MSGLVKAAAARVAPAMRTGIITQRASLYTRPAKEKLGTAVSQVYIETLGRLGRSSQGGVFRCTFPM